MTRRKIDSENIRKINSVGGASYSITLPIQYMRELKWKAKQKVVVRKRGRKLIIEDWEK